MDNLAEGKPVNYTYNADNLVFNGVDFTQYGQVIFSWSRNITITNSNFSDDSLNLFYTNTSIISNNNINSTKGYGIYLYSSSNSNTFLNNTITTSGGDGYGIILQSNSNNNVFSKMNIKTSSTNAYAIYIYGNNSFTINDSILNSSLVQEIYVESAVAGGVWNFTNVTRANGNSVNISWTSGSVGTMNVHWYVSVNVTELFLRNVLPDANVTLRDRNNLSVFNILTDSNGSITPRAVLEYSRNSTLTNYFTPHNLNVTLANYTGYYNSTINLSILLNHQINVQIIDLLTPSITSVINTPSSADDLDPGVVVNVNVNINDNNSNFDSAVLQWKNSTTSLWANITMVNITSKSTSISLNTSFTLPNYQDNITYRIIANDTSGLETTSSNYTLNSSWDCAWRVNSDLGATAGWSENKFIGNITINNIGDSAYSASNCSLDFRLTYDLSEGRVYFDNIYYKPSGIYTLNAKSNQTILVNATFPTEVKQESVVITTTEISLISNMSSANTTATIISTQGGPYLYTQITSYPSVVYLTLQNLSLNGYVRNLLGSAAINITNTAYNVSFNWTFPSGLANSSGNKSIFYVNITDSDTHYNNVNISFSDIASMTSGVKTFYLNTLGYNLTGSLIRDSNNQTLISHSVSVSFLCYNTSDSVCVSSCGYTQDPDCSVPSTSTPTTSSSGGSGGSSTITQTIQSSADFQLVRGKQNEVYVLFKNKYPNSTLKDLEFSVEGKIAKYMDISPKTISYLSYGQEINLTLSILSPTYIELGKQQITIIIRGKKDGQIYIENKKIILEIHEITKEEAENIVASSEGLIRQLNDANLSSDYLNGLLDEMKTSLGTFNYEKINENSQIISKQVGYALDSKKIISELKELINTATEKGIDVSGSIRVIKLSELSLNRREFEQAYERAKEAQITYALEVKGEIGKLAYYLKNNPGTVSLTLFFMIIFSFGAYRLEKIREIKNKIKILQDEEKILNELMKLVQRECFINKKMSMEEYNTSILQYEKKLTRVIQDLIEAENERVHLLKFSNKETMLKRERENMIDSIKNIQTKFLSEKKMEPRAYTLKMESYNKKIGEIDEKLATLEAKKAIKNKIKFIVGSVKRAEPVIK